MEKRLEISLIGKQFSYLIDGKPNDFYYYWNALFNDNGLEFRDFFIFGMNFYNRKGLTGDPKFNLTPSINIEDISRLLEGARYIQKEYPLEIPSEYTLISSPQPRLTESPDLSSASTLNSPSPSNLTGSPGSFLINSPDSTLIGSPEPTLESTLVGLTEDNIMSKSILNELSLFEDIVEENDFSNSNMKCDNKKYDVNKEYEVNMENFYNGTIIGTILDENLLNDGFYSIIGKFVLFNNDTYLLNSNNQYVGNIYIIDYNNLIINLPNGQIFQYYLKDQILSFQGINFKYYTIYENDQEIGVIIKDQNGMDNYYLRNKNNSISYLLSGNQNYVEQNKYMDRNTDNISEYFDFSSFLNNDQPLCGTDDNSKEFL